MRQSLVVGEKTQAPVIKENAQKRGRKNMYWSDEMLAASTGIIGTSVILLGVLSLPAMLGQGYSKPFVILQLMVPAVVLLWPQLVIWLPAVAYG